MSVEAKSAGDAHTRPIDDELLALEFDRDPEKLKPTANDVREMGLFGIEPVFRRRFKFVAMVGFGKISQDPRSDDEH